MMPKWSQREKVLGALCGKNEGQPSVISAHQTATVELMQRLSAFWPQANQDPDKMARLAMGGSTILGFETIHVPFDHLVEAEALGARLSPGTEYEFPEVTSIIDERPENFEFPTNLRGRGRIGVVLRAIESIKEVMGDDVPIIGSVMGPFTVSLQAFGFSKVLKWIAKGDQSLSHSMKMLVRPLLDYAMAQVAAGATIICIEEALTSPDLINPKFFKSEIAPELDEMISGIKAPVIICIDDDRDLSLSSTLRELPRAVLLSPRSSPTAASRLVSRGVRLAGNIAPEILYRGDEREISAAVRLAYNSGIRLIAPSGSILPQTKISSIRKMVDEVRALELQRRN
jgi:MtaA/CmuA family methyltransferase